MALTDAQFSAIVEMSRVEALQSLDRMIAKSKSDEELNKGLVTMLEAWAARSVGFMSVFQDSYIWRHANIKHFKADELRPNGVLLVAGYPELIAKVTALVNEYAPPG